MATIVKKSAKMSSEMYFLEGFPYPDAWKDDAKMSVYLNEFRPKNVNENHYDQKMKFWRDMIEYYCEYKGSARMSISELKHVFKRKGTSPYCLQEVINNMISEELIISKDNFMQQPKSYVGWAVGILSQPLSWGFSMVKNKLVNTQDEQQQFISKNVVMNQARLLMENTKFHNKIISLEDLLKEDIHGVSPDGLPLVLQFLSTVDKTVYIEEVRIASELTVSHPKILVKFSGPLKPVNPISDLERSIYNLEITEKFLLSTVESKENQLQEMLRRTKECLKDGKKQMAKSLLRKKHMLESDLVKTTNILDNVQTLLHRTNFSKNDKEILNAYKAGSAAIKSAFVDSGMNLDNVHDVLEDMQEVFANQEEYENAISGPLTATSNIDDSDLEKELADLISEKNTQPKTDINKDRKLPEKSELNEMERIDRELELRLQRLRMDSTVLGEPKLAPVKEI